GLQNLNQVYIFRVQQPVEPAGLHFALVGAVDLPAGSYLIHAIAPVTNLDSDDQSGECYIGTVPGGGTFGAAPPGTGGDGVFRIHGSGSIGVTSPASWSTQIPMFDVVNLASPTRVQLYCAGLNMFFRPTIVAVSIANIISQN